MPDGSHQFVNIALAGVRSPRASGKQGETAEQWGDEVSLSQLIVHHNNISWCFHEQARFFTESRLLQRAVRVQLLSLPAPTATPFQSAADGVAPASEIGRAHV